MGESERRYKMAVESAHEMTKAEYNELMMNDAMKMLEKAMKQINEAYVSANSASRKADAALDYSNRAAVLLEKVKL